LVGHEFHAPYMALCQQKHVPQKFYSWVSMSHQPINFWYVTILINATKTKSHKFWAYENRIPQIQSPMYHKFRIPYPTSSTKSWPTNSFLPCREKVIYPEPLPGSMSVVKLKRYLTWDFSRRRRRPGEVITNTSSVVGR
jgi:hypothetical protein